MYLGATACKSSAVIEDRKRPRRRDSSRIISSIVVVECMFQLIRME